MALPDKTSRIRPKDYDLSTVQDSIASALDAVLRLLNSVFTETRQGINLKVSGALNTATGVKAIVGPFCLQTASTPAGVSRMDFGYQTTTTNLNFGWVASHSGSILAVTGRGTTGANATTTVTVYVEAAPTVLTASAATTAGTSTTLSAVVAKGVIPFTAGQRIEVRVAYSVAAITATTNACLTVEMSA